MFWKGRKPPIVKLDVARLAELKLAAIEKQVALLEHKVKRMERREEMARLRYRGSPLELPKRIWQDGEPPRSGT